VVLLFWISQNFKLAGIILGAFIGGVILFGGVGYFLARYLGEVFANRVRLPAGIRFAAQRFKGKPQFAAQQITTLAVAMMALLLLIVLQIDVLGAWRSSIPQNSPNRFLINIQPDQKEGVLQLLTANQAQLDFDLYPMIRGRLVRINQREISSKDYQADNAKRLIDREFNLSYADKIPQKNQIVDGVWFSPGGDIKQVSIESGLMKTLQLYELMGGDMNLSN
jgi:putative ABC transport system permease protein